MRHACLLSLALSIACSAPAAPHPEPTSGGGETTIRTAASEPVSSDPPPNQPGSPECAAYLDHYRRCASVLAPEIAAGDRRSADAEEGWIQYMERSAEAPAVPSACRTMDADLSTVCP